MNRYDRYLTRRMIETQFKVLVSMILLVSVIDLIVTRQDAILKYQVPLTVVLRYYITLIPTILFEFQAAAIAVLVAALIVLGKAAQDREITALLAGGVSLWRIARMPILIALATAFLSFFVQEHYGVQAVENHGVITKKYFSKLSGQERVGASWTNLADGWTCHILKYNLRANSGQDVYMHAIRENTLEEIRANRIYWDEDRQCWLLENGRWSTFDKDKQWEVLTRRITQVEAPFKESPAELFALSKPAQTKTAEELARDIVRAEQLGMPTREYIVNYHVKFAQPALCFVIIWLGIPFAMRLRRGGVLIGFGVSVIIAVCYLMVFAFAVGLGYMGVWPPLVAAWAANVAFLVGGVLLFWLTPT